MKTWNDYKEHVKAVDPVMGKEIEAIEEKVSIIANNPEYENIFGIQHLLASRNSISQSPVKKVRGLRNIPNYETFLNVFQSRLGLASHRSKSLNNVFSRH